MLLKTVLEEASSTQLIECFDHGNAQVKNTHTFAFLPHTQSDAKIRFVKKGTKKGRGLSDDVHHNEDTRHGRARADYVERAASRCDMLCVE